MTRKNRTRALRNGAIGLAVLFAVWLVLGAPLPTAQLRLRRAERQCLCDYSQVVWRYDSRDYLGRDVNLRGLDTLVGLTPTEVHVYARELLVWPRDPAGPTLVVLPAELPYDTQDGQEQAPAFLSVDLPDGAESARLTLALTREYSPGQTAARSALSETYEMDGVREGDLFRFQLIRRYPYHPYGQGTEEELCLYQAENDAFYELFRFAGKVKGLDAALFLEFFDGDGAPISRTSHNIKGAELFMEPPAQ